MAAVGREVEGSLEAASKIPREIETCAGLGFVFELEVGLESLSQQRGLRPAASFHRCLQAESEIVGQFHGYRSHGNPFLAIQ